MTFDRQPRSSRGRSGRALRIVMGVLAGLVLAVTIDVVRLGGLEAWFARHGLTTVYIARGERVDIGGRALYLDCRGTGSPTVILEAGMGAGAGSWGVVQDALAATTRTCAYDRAGRGSSDPRDRHTVADATLDLRALLTRAGETAPFVVVGHSLGEAYVRVFADGHREEIVGIVLIDGFSVDLESDWIHPLLDALRPEYEQRQQSLKDLVAQVEDIGWAASEAQLRGSRVAGIAIEVLRAPRAEPRLDDATNAAIGAAWESAYGSLSPGQVRYEIAWGAGHIIQADRPDLVIAAVRRLIDAARD